METLILWVLRVILIAIWVRLLLKLSKHKNGWVYTSVVASIFLVLFGHVFVFLGEVVQVDIPNSYADHTIILALMGSGLSMTHLVRGLPKR